MEINHHYEASKKDWLAVWAVVLGAFVAILDTSITNSSLQDIQGSLSASLSEGSWISTSYIVTEIIIIPLTAFFCHVFSTKKYLIANVIVFLLFSLLCGMAWNLNSMILFRAFQGIAGGALIPVAITVIVTRLPARQQVYGFIMFGLATTFAPAIGPSLGGWLTSQYGWPAIFYINLLPGIPLVMMLLKSFDDEPTNLPALKTADFSGIISLSLFLGSLTVVLEEGNREDWLSSNYILNLTIICIVSLATFIYVELTKKKPVVNLRLLGRKNFFLSCVTSFALGVSIYAPNYLMPIYMGSVLGFNALDIGMVMMWSGFPQLLIMPLVPKLSEKVDARILMSLGFGLFAISFYMTSPLTLDFGSFQFSAAMFVRALGVPLLITPSSAVAYDGIEPENVGDASGLFNMMRNLGGSVGIGLMSTLSSRRYAVHFDQLSEKFNLTDHASMQRLYELSNSYVAQGMDKVSAQMKAVGMMNGIMNRESYILSFGDCFLILSWIALFCIFCVVFMNKVKGGGGGAAH
jgi:DHA2 family multidrug resistance protein